MELHCILYLSAISFLFLIFLVARFCKCFVWVRRSLHSQATTRGPSIIAFWLGANNARSNSWARCDDCRMVCSIGLICTVSPRIVPWHLFHFAPVCSSIYTGFGGPGQSEEEGSTYLQCTTAAHNGQLISLNRACNLDIRHWQYLVYFNGI